MKNILLLLTLVFFMSPSVNYAQNGTVTDIDGNIYNTVQIGTQCWMKENLKTTHFQNSTAIDEMEDDSAWTSVYAGNLQTPAWCYYGQDSTYNANYGKLYNWYVVADPQNVCPVGWHVPSKTEWTTLINYLGGQNAAGGAMKELTLWQSPNVCATNSSGFSAVPGGHREENADFWQGGNRGDMWSSTEYNAASAWYCWLYYNHGMAIITEYYKSDGASVRCLKDIQTGINKIRDNTIILTLYPNPTTDQLNIDLGGLPAEQVRIYSMTGQLLNEFKQPTNNHVDISNLATGIYIAEVKVNGVPQRVLWSKL